MVAMVTSILYYMYERTLMPQCMRPTHDIRICIVSHNIVTYTVGCDTVTIYVVVCDTVTNIVNH